MLTLREVETHFAHLPPGLLEMAPELRRLSICHARVVDNAGRLIKSIYSFFRG